jgi:hypothetical protein
MAKAYFLKGSAYLRYDVENDAADAGYPKPIDRGWTGLTQAGFDSGIDAALDLGAGKVYFFKGALYARIDQSANSLDRGYPLPIADHWPGLAETEFTDSLDAAVNAGNGEAMFFKGAQCLSYDIAADRSDVGGTRAIAEALPGMAEADMEGGIDAAVDWPGSKLYFFKGSRYVRFDLARGTVDDGYPREVVEDWPTLAGAGFASDLADGWRKL